MEKQHIFDMTGKICIVTGGSGYLGSACVEALKGLGATVVNADIMQRPEGKEDLFLETNIKEKDAFQKLFQKVCDTYGKLDAVVNCAFYGPKQWSSTYGRFLEYMSDENWEEYMDGTLNSTMRSVRDCVPFMKENGGSVVNFCSMYGLVAPDFRVYGDNPVRNPPCYGASKAGVYQLTKYAASELGEHGLRVNCVSPGPFPNVPNSAENPIAQQLAEKTMLHRIGVNKEIAGAVCLLASDASSFMTGSNIVVDGGWTAW